MDPISMAASVAGLVSLTINVSSTVGSYCKSVKNARKDVQEVAQELSSMHIILHQLDELLRSQQVKTKFFESTSVLATAITVCSENVTKISSKVQKLGSDNLAGVWERFKWPVSEKEMQKILDNLRRCAATFQFSLTVEGCTMLSHSAEDASQSLGIQLETADRVLELTRNIGTMAESAKEAFKVSNQVSEILRLITDHTATLQTVQSISHGVNTLTVRSQESKEMEILSWLSSYKYSRIHHDIRARRMVGTGDWLLKHKDFNVWMSRSNPILWCSGGPGAGKSVLTSLIIDHILEEILSPNDAIVYFYFDYRDQQTQTPPYFLASLLRQIAARSKPLPQFLHDFYDRFKEEEPQHFMPELREAFRLLRETYQRCFIVIDALDECKSQAHRKEIVQFLNSLLGTTTRVFVTSRLHAHDIKEYFADALRVDVEATETDIKRYCSWMIEQSTSAAELISGSLREQVIDTIASKAHGIFLLPVLQLQGVLEAMTKSEVKATLSNLSADLGQAFENTIQRIEDEPRNRRRVATEALMWVSHARRPLHVDELCHALATKLGDTELDQDDLLPPRAIVESCSGLLVLDDEGSTIGLVHYTLKDFLQSRGAQLLQQEETYITQVLITYLCFDRIGDSITKETQIDNNHSNIDEEPLTYPSFLEYAATNWGYHAKFSNSSQINELALAYLENAPKLSRAMLSSTQSLIHPEDHSRYRDSRESRNRRNKTALHVVAEFGLVDLLGVLLDRGLNIEARDGYRNTPLHDAAIHGQTDALSYLLEHGAILDARNFDGNTPLYLAVSYCHEQLAATLIERGAMVNRGCIDGWSPLHKAADNGNFPIAQALLDHGANVLRKSARGLIPLHRAAGRGHVRMVQLLLKRRSPVDAISWDGWTPLHGASSSGQADVVGTLLNHGAGVNKQSKDGRTALHRACRGGHYDAVVRLLTENPDLCVQDCSMNTPLHRAARGGHERICKLLLQQISVLPHTQLSAPNRLGHKPEKEASSSGHWNVAALLRREESLCSAPGVEERDDLELAIEEGHLPRVKELLSNGADINKINEDGSSTALHQALLLGNESIARTLLENEADVFAATSDGWQALHCAASKGLVHMVSLCLRRKADVAARTLDGQTALHKACKTGNTETVELLLRSGADVEAQDDWGWRPLHTASAAGNQDIVELLIDHDADFEARDSNSCTVQACAARAGKHDLVEYLRRLRYERILKRS